MCEYCGATTHVADGTLVVEEQAAAADDSIPEDPAERYAWARQRLPELASKLPAPVTYSAFTAALRATVAVLIEAGAHDGPMKHNSKEDVDQVMRIAYNLAHEYRPTERGADLDGAELVRFVLGCLDALHELRTKPEYELNLPFIHADASGPMHFNRKLNPALLNQLAAREPVEPRLAPAASAPIEFDLTPDEDWPPKRKSLWRKLFG